MNSGTEALAVGAAACVIAAGLVLGRLHLLPTGLDPARDPVSDYGTTRHHLYYRAMVVLLGAGAGLLIVVLARDGHAGDRGLVFLGVFAASRLAIAGFMTDRSGRRPTRTGRIHLVLAAAAFTTIAFAANDITGSLVGSPNWSGGVASPLRFAAHAVAVTAVLTALAFVLPDLRRRLLGMVERLLYVAMIAWLLIAALHVVVLAG